MSVPIRETKGAFMDYKTVASDLNALQLNPNYKNNEAGDSYRESDKKPPAEESRLGDPFGGKAKKAGGKLKGKK